MLGGRDRVAAGRVHHNDPVARRSVHIHIVHANPGAADDLQFLRGIEHGGRDFRLAAHDQSGKFRDERDEFGFLEAGVDDDFEGAAGGEFFDTALGNRIGY